MPGLESIFSCSWIACGKRQSLGRRLVQILLAAGDLRQRHHAHRIIGLERLSIAVSVSTARSTRSKPKVEHSTEHFDRQRPIALRRVCRHPIAPAAWRFDPMRGQSRSWRLLGPVRCGAAPAACERSVPTAARSCAIRWESPDTFRSHSIAASLSPWLATISAIAVRFCCRLGVHLGVPCRRSARAFFDIAGRFAGFLRTIRHAVDVGQHFFEAGGQRQGVIFCGLRRRPVRAA